MDKILLILMFSFLSYCTLFGQTYQYDNNHQVTEIKYDNGITATIQYDGNGNRISYLVLGSVVPVKLLYFHAQKKGSEALLTWTTSQEINTDKFDVEFSKDGTIFQSFTSVPAKGISSIKTDYRTLHCCPIVGVNYYRLKMIDRDGSFKYSEIRKVVFEFINLMKLFPNPATSKSALNISFTKPFAKDATVTVYNANGAFIYSSILFKNEILIQIETQGFATGSYYVIVATGDDIYKEKFVKQ